MYSVKPLKFVQPYSAGGVQGASSIVVSTSNYVGAARDTIASLCIRMGIAYSADLSKNNTHLICAYPVGEKYARSLDWNIHGIPIFD